MIQVDGIENTQLRKVKRKSVDEMAHKSTTQSNERRTERETLTLYTKLRIKRKGEGSRQAKEGNEQVDIRQEQ